MRYGIFFGYARDLVPARAYWVCDERDLFVRGVLRIVASESVRLLAVDDGQGGHKIVYPFVVATDAARQKAITAIKRAMPSKAPSGTKRPRESSMAAECGTPRAEGVGGESDTDAYHVDLDPGFARIDFDTDEEADTGATKADTARRAHVDSAARCSPHPADDANAQATTNPSTEGETEATLPSPLATGVPCMTPMPPEGPEVADKLERRAREAAQPDPTPQPGPHLSVEELDTQMAADEGVPFLGVAHAWDSEPNNVVPAAECAAVTAHESRQPNRQF